MRDFGKKQKTIGLIIENLSIDYSKEIIHSVRTAIAAYRDTRLIVLAGDYNMVNEKKDSRFFAREVNNTVYRLEEELKLDGLILTLPNIGGIRGDDIMNEHYPNFLRVPKVFISTDVKDAVTVRYDNAIGIRETMDYLVNVKGITRFCMLGGREDNADAQNRKQIFRECLEERKLSFTDDMYEKTDMSINSKAEAARLMERNADAEAVFCVNDQVAVPLYEVLKERGLMPGKNIQVFGFDNTRFSGNMQPPLASIGADGITLGEKAVELLLKQMNGEEVQSVVLPTRLYGKESLEYEMYEYTTMEMLRIDPAFVRRMFHDCFYRYASEIKDREAVNLERLFIEFISRMLKSMLTSSMTAEEFAENKRLIDIFFDNGAMRYTDPARLVRSIERLQNSMNRSQKSIAANLMNNRCFAYMKDKAILSIADDLDEMRDVAKKARERLQEFIVRCMSFGSETPITEETVIRSYDRLGMTNSALFLFEEPVVYHDGEEVQFPQKIRLMCSVRNGELRVISKERRLGNTSDMLLRTELPKSIGYVAIPVFYGRKIYGFIISEVNESVADRGEYFAKMFARSLCLNESGKGEKA